MTPPPRITHPQSIPVISTDAHLPPVAMAAMTPDALRDRFAMPAPWQPEMPGDAGRFNPDGNTTAASVLIPLVMRADGLHVLLTRRTEHLRDHAGQISFPGGRAEADDVDSVATALRETEEEVGLDRRHIEVIGSLPDYSTISSYVITPVVALVEPDFTLALDSFEVAQAFEVPLAYLMTPAHHRHHEIEFAGQRRRFLSMPWQDPTANDQTSEFFIWGATAAMLRNLYRFLSL